MRRRQHETLSQFEKLHYVTFTTLLPGIQALISTVVASLLIALLIVVNPKIALISAGLLDDAARLRATAEERRRSGDLEGSLALLRQAEAVDRAEDEEPPLPRRRRERDLRRRGVRGSRCWNCAVCAGHDHEEPEVLSG